MCEVCHIHGPLSPERIACRATPEQIARLLRDILNADHKPHGSTE